MGLSKSRKGLRVKWYQWFRPDKREDGYPYGPVPFRENGGKENNRDLMRNSILVALSDDENGNFTGSVPVSDDLRFKKSKSKPRRGLSRAFKAVMFPIYTARKSRSKKFDREKTAFRSNSSSISSRIEKMLQSFGSRNSSASISKDNPLSNSHRTDSSAGSIFSTTATTAAPSSASSSQASSLASNSRSASARKKSIAIDLKQLEKKQNPAAFHGGERRSTTGAGCCKTMLGLYFLFVCLLPLVLCGKTFAVFCTSSSLFLIPCLLEKIAGAGDRFRRWCPFVNSSVDPVDPVDPVDCVAIDFDKKVVGALETQRSRNGRLL